MPRLGESPQHNFVPELAIGPELPADGPTQLTADQLAGRAAPEHDATTLQVVSYVTARGETVTATSVEEAIRPIGGGPGCTYLGGLATRKAEMLFKLEAKGQAARAAQLEAVSANPDRPSPAKPKSAVPPQKTAETKKPSAQRPDVAALSRPEAVSLARPEPSEKPGAHVIKPAPLIELRRDKKIMTAVQASDLAEATNLSRAVSPPPETPPASLPPIVETAPLTTASEPANLPPSTEKLFAAAVVNIDSPVPSLASELATQAFIPEVSLYSQPPDAATKQAGELAAADLTGVNVEDLMGGAVLLETANELAGETEPPLLWRALMEVAMPAAVVEDVRDGLFEPAEALADRATVLARSELPPVVASTTPAESRLVAGALVSGPAAVLEIAMPQPLQEKLTAVVESADSVVLAKLAAIQALIVESIGQLQAQAVAETEPEHVEAIEQLLEAQCLDLLRALQVEIDEQTFKRFIVQLHESSQPNRSAAARRAGLDEGMHEHKQNFGSMAQDFSQAITQKLSSMKLARFMVHGTLA